MNLYDERYTPVPEAEGGFVEVNPDASTGQTIRQLLGRPLPDGVTGAWLQQNAATLLYRMDGGTNLGFSGEAILIPQSQIVRLSNREQIDAITIACATPVVIQFFRGGAPGTTE